MRQGDKVRFMDYPGTATVLRIEGGYAELEDEDGMELRMPVGECILLDSNEMERLGKVRIRDKERGSMKRKPVRKQDSIVEVDLHLYRSCPDNALEIQMNTVRSVLDRHRRSRGVKIVLIHGCGDGVLRKNILDEIERHYHGFTVSDAPFDRYGVRGALMVVPG